MKRRLISAAALMLLAATWVGTSLAYFTDSAQAENVFTVGNVAIDLSEPSWDSQEALVYPGQVLHKDPIVTNTGTNPCFVRMEVSGLSFFEAEGEILYRTGGRENTLGSHWVQGEDGFFYYDRVLDPGESTSALFEEIVIPTGVTGHQEKLMGAITLSAQAVQSQGAREKYEDVLTMSQADIAAWFHTAMEE